MINPVSTKALIPKYVQLIQCRGFEHQRTQPPHVQVYTDWQLNNMALDDLVDSCNGNLNHVTAITKSYTQRQEYESEYLDTARNKVQAKINNCRTKTEWLSAMTQLARNYITANKKYLRSEIIAVPQFPITPSFIEYALEDNKTKRGRLDVIEAEYVQHQRAIQLVEEEYLQVRAEIFQH